MKALFQCLCLLFLCSLLVLPAKAALRPEHVVFVYNETSDFSRDCALTYAKLRAIPSKNLLPLNLDSKKKDITQAEFDAGMREPLRVMSQSRNLQFAGDSRFGLYPIYAMVVMPDLPWRIKPTPQQKGEKARPWPMTDAASVDSELSLVGAARFQRFGSLRNAYYKKDEGLPDKGFPVISVCRIDSPDRAVTKRLMTTPIQVEKQGGLKGAIVVDWGGPHEAGDVMFRTLAQHAADLGQQLYVHPTKSTIEPSYPMPNPCALYFGWYSQDVCGPFKMDQQKPNFTLAPGAVAVHLHSFSATSLNAKRAWVGPMLMKGAAVTAGNTWEPYLHGCLELAIFHDRLMKGYCVGEAALMATPSLSWQGVVVGDPLYRPYPKVKKQSMSQETSANVLFVKGRYNDALTAFAQLHKGARDEATRLRSAIACAQALLLLKRNAEAKGLLEEIEQHDSKSVYIGAVRAMTNRYFPPPAPPKKS